MKMLLRAAVCFVCVAVLAHAQMLESNEKFVGSYRRMMIGGTWTLSLKKSGAYTLEVQGSVAGSKPEIIEAGVWAYESHQVILKTAVPPISGTNGEYRQLSLGREADGRLALASAGRRNYVFVWADDGKPNQPPEPTVMSVTPRADARVAPATTVAHL